jgi:hypothetical protein
MSRRARGFGRQEAGQAVAKRTRGTRVAQHRPGQRVASSRPPSTRPPTGGTGTTAVAATPFSPSDDLVVEQALAAEAVSSAPNATVSGPDIRRSTPGRAKVKPNSLLAARSQTEYVYVGQDLRRIAVVAAGMFGVLLLLWVLLVVVGLFGIY